MKEGKHFNFHPGQQDIWLPLGDIDYGLIHLLSGRGKTGHLGEFMELDSRLNNPQIIVKFIYDRITQGTGVIMNHEGIVVYAFKFAGEGPQDDPYYLTAHISGSDGMDLGRIYTSFPVLSDSSNYREYRLY
jgi:hypothetical protein